MLMLFTKKQTSKTRYTSNNGSYKLILILLLAGDVSINPGPAISRNLRFCYHKRPIGSG